MKRCLQITASLRIGGAEKVARDIGLEARRLGYEVDYLVFGDEVCGYAGMWVMFDEAHMTNIAVDPEHRKQGIARKMILHLMKTAMDKGAERMTLEVRENNHNAQRLYASLDFAYAGTRKHYYSDTGENALILWNDCIIETYERNIYKDA